MALKEITVIDQSEEDKCIEDNMQLIKGFRFQRITDINMIRVFFGCLVSGVGNGGYSVFKT